MFLLGISRPKTTLHIYVIVAFAYYINFIRLVVLLLPIPTDCNMSEFQTHQQLILRVPPFLADLISNSLNKKNVEPLGIEIVPEGITIAN